MYTTAFRHKLIHISTTQSKTSKMAANGGNVPHLRAIITSRTVCTFKMMYCTLHAAALHNSEFAIHLMIVGLLSTALFQYLKCQDQRISKNCRSTFIFCSSWNVEGVPFFTFRLPGGQREPLPPVSYATAGFCCQRNDFVVTIAVRWSNFFLCRKGKALCKRPFEWHRQQPEKYKQNFDVSLPGKITADAHRKGAWGHSNESLSITAVHNTA